MEVVRLGGLYDEETKIHQMGSVWDKNALSPTIDTAQGGYRQPMIVEVKQIGNFMSTAKRENPNPGRVYDENGLSPTLTNMQGGYRQPMIVAINTESDGTARTIKSQYYKNGVANLANDNAKGGKYACTGVIVAMRGRNPENPSDRTPGAPTEQRLEPNSQGICNTLTSVQKDNLVMETVKRFGNIYPSCGENGNIYDSDGLSPTLKAGQGVSGNGIGSCNAPKIVENQYRIRKLTPKECWRLMGFTDEDFHKAEATNSNTRLYQQAGNSICVPVLEAIFRQMHIQNVPTWNGGD